MDDLLDTSLAPHVPGVKPKRVVLGKGQSSLLWFDDSRVARRNPATGGEMLGAILGDVIGSAVATAHALLAGATYAEAYHEFGRLPEELIDVLNAFRNRFSSDDRHSPR